MVGPLPVATVIARLKAKAPVLKLVESVADLRTALDQRPNKAPAAYVLSAERGGQIKYTGPVAMQNVEVDLQLVLFVSSSRSEGTGAGARELMDQVLQQTRQALFGWAPSDAFEALTFRASRDELYGGGWLVAQQVFRSGYRMSQQVQP